MEKINFQNNTAPYINDTNLNRMQDNIEDAIDTAKEEILELNNFSTQEKQVGKWINDKPLYKKTFFYSISETTKVYNHNISNVDLIWINVGESFFINHGEYFITLGHYNSTADWSRFYVTETEINCKFGSAYENSTKETYITLYYTKTTD